MGPLAGGFGVTTTSGAWSSEQETPAVSTALTDADDGLSNIASAIPPVDREVLTLKHSAFLAQLLMDEVDLVESTHGRSHDHALFSMQATDAPTRSPAPSRNTPPTCPEGCLPPPPKGNKTTAKREACTQAVEEGGTVALLVAVRTLG